MRRVGQGVVGSIQTADVVGTPEPWFKYKDQAECTGAIHDARLTKASPPQLITTQLRHQKKIRAYMREEVGWDVSCVNASEFAHREVPSRSTYIASIPDHVADLVTDLTTDLATDLAADLNTDLTIDTAAYLNIDLDLNHGVIEEDTVATITVVPSILDKVIIIHLLRVAATRVGQWQAERRKRRIIMS